VHLLDTYVGRIVQGLQQKSMWGNTVFLYVSDNGGGLALGVGGNNYPLRGGKGSEWEGGVRLAAFLSGGFLPSDVRGTTYQGVMHVVDWYATLAGLGGQDAKDIPGEAAGVPPVDSIDYWLQLSTVRAPVARKELHLSPQSLLKLERGAWYKILIGTVGNDFITGPNYPNSSCPFSASCRVGFATPFGVQPYPHDCGSGCLFNVDKDPTEGQNLNLSSPAILQSLQEALQLANKKYIEPWRGCNIVNYYCAAAEQQWSGHYGPFLNVANCDSCVHTTADYFRNPTVPKTTNECNCLNRLQCARDPDCRWVQNFCELAPESGKISRAERWLRALPASFTPSNLSTLVDDR